MKHKWIIIAFGLLTVINLSALGTFVYYRGSRSAVTDCPVNKTVNHSCYLKQHLEMTDEQTSKVDEAEKIFHPVTESLALKMKEKRIELVGELMKESADSTRIENILKQVDSLQASMQRQIVHLLLHEKGVLTSPQQEKFFSIVLGQLCMEIDSIKQTQCQKYKSQ